MGNSSSKENFQELIGRAEVDDFEAILAMTNRGEEGNAHLVPGSFETEFTWDYSKGARPGLDKLYEKAKRSQWNAETDLDWSIEVDPHFFYPTLMTLRDQDLSGTPLAKFGDKEWADYAFYNAVWFLSQFLHGEQGALLCTARIVEMVPWVDAKYYASTQVMDEARHVEVFSKYLSTKLGDSMPINVHLAALLDDILADNRWDMIYLGMQIMVEGLALASFGTLQQNIEEPLLKELLRYVMSDEARHVAFGVLSLKEAYSQMSSSELRERQEFAFEAAVRMRDRFYGQEIWPRFDIDPMEVIPVLENREYRRQYRRNLFTKIVPNCKKLGLLDANDGWLRERFTELGVIEFENALDTSVEYETLSATR